MSGLFVPSQAALNQLYTSACSDAITVNSTQTTLQSFVTAYLKANSSGNYANMVLAADAWLASSRPQTALGLPAATPIAGLRVQVIVAGGVTAYDSNAGVNNVFAKIGIPNNTLSSGGEPSAANFINSGKYFINENQGTRSYNMSAWLSNSGVAYETKNSGSTGTFQSYIAVRQAATSVTPLGNIVISFNANIN